MTQQVEIEQSEQRDPQHETALNRLEVHPVPRGVPTWVCRYTTIRRAS